MARCCRWELSRLEVLLLQPPMLRIRGTRDTLLTALVAEWSAQQLALPAEPDRLQKLQQLIGRRGKRPQSPSP